MADNQAEAALTQAPVSQETTPAKNKGGRPKIDINWEVFEAMCVSHCTLWEIADYFRCSVDSIQRACKRQYGVSFAVFYQQKASLGKTSLRRKQFQTAMGNGAGSATMQIWLGKNWLQQRDSLEVSGPAGGPIPHEIDTKDRATLEREISAFFAGIQFAGQRRERVGSGGAPVLDAEAKGLHPAPAEETAEAKG